MTYHAKLSPSSASRWLVCTGSIQLIDKYIELYGEPETSAAAELGTKAHEVFENKLLDKPFDVLDSETMSNVEKAYDFIKSEIKNFEDQGYTTELHSESWCSLAGLNIEGLDGGTTDVAIVYSKGDEVNVAIYDYKNGRLPVDVTDNPQLMIYAYAYIYDKLSNKKIQNIKICVIQPKIDNITTQTLKYSDVENWFNEVVIPQAKATASDEPTFKVTKLGCQFCPAKSICKAYINRNVSFNIDIDHVRDSELHDIYSKLEELEDCKKAITSRIQRLALDGNQYVLDNFKISKSTRRTSDNTKYCVFTNPLLEHLRYSHVYETKMLPFGTIKKHLSNTDLTKSEQEDLLSKITKTSQITTITTK